MKSHKKLLSLILSLSTLICCFANLSVMASDIDVSGYTYVVDNMTFYKGDRQLGSPEGATEVAVDVTERIPTEETNTVIISAYSADGTFLGMNHSSQNFAFAETQNIKLSLDIPTGKTVSEIRAFVWNSFNGMMPLSNSLSSKNNIIHTLNLKDLDEYDYDVTGTTPYLKFYVGDDNISTKYRLNPDGVEIYVNGVKVSTGTEIYDYVIDGDDGEVKLVDTYKTDGLIDAIYVNKYVSGLFDGITTSGTVWFKNPDPGLSSIVLNDEDESLEYNIYYNGEAITVNELQKNDVLTIAYDVTAVSVRESKFYDIFVSKNVITETFTGINTRTHEAKFGDTYYPFASEAKYTAFSSAELGDVYTVYLDVFGRIFKADFSYLSYNYAIVEEFTKSPSDDEYKLTLFSADGTQKSYFFDASEATVRLPDGMIIDKDTEGSADALNTAVKNAVYSSDTTKTVIENRVITYKTSLSSGKIIKLEFLDESASTIDEFEGTTMMEFSARRNTIGFVRLGDITRIIDATRYASDGELSEITIADLTDGVNYKAYAYGSKIDNTHQFVLITDSDYAVNGDETGDDNVTVTPEIRFAVVTEDGYAKETDEETGDIIYTISAMYGDDDKLVVSDDISTTTLDNLKKGEVILFKTNSKGQIYHIEELTTWSGVPTQAALATGSLVNENTDYSNLTALTINNITGENFSANFTHDWNSTSTDAIKIVYGPVMERTDYDIAFGKIDANGKTDIDWDVSVFDFSDDIRVYTYDYAQGPKYRFDYHFSDTSAIPATVLLPTNMEDYGDTVDWNKTVDGALVNHETVTFAFAIVVNDEVQDILAFFYK